jgi:tetratricopeptide (TPR) repeat protein
MTMIPQDHVAVSHGKMTVSVPRSIFEGDDAVPDKSEAERFGRMLMERYPWLSENAVDVIMRNARNIVLEMIDEETCGRAKARLLMSEDRPDEAVSHLRRHLERDPQNADTWYLLGEALCRMGRTEEGYAAFRRGRTLF